MSIGNVGIAQASPLECEKYIGCEKKVCEIERQINIAKNKSNERKLSGLNIALDKTQSNCSNESIVEDLLSKIEEIEEDILDYEDDLEEAIEDEKADKILKYNNKIAREKQELKHVESELATMQKES